MKLAGCVSLFDIGHIRPIGPIGPYKESFSLNKSPFEKGGVCDSRRGIFS